jgi:hypothetical protein
MLKKGRRRDDGQGVDCDNVDGPNKGNQNKKETLRFYYQKTLLLKQTILLNGRL